MCIEPEHELRPALRGGMGGGAVHRAEAEAVIAAEEDRQALRHGVRGRAAERLGPADGFGKVVEPVARCDLDRIGGDVAEVGDRMPKVAQGTRQAGGAVGVGAHEAALAGLAAVHWCADKQDGLVGHVLVP